MTQALPEDFDGWGPEEARETYGATTVNIQSTIKAFQSGVLHNWGTPKFMVKDKKSH